MLIVAVGAVPVAARVELLYFDGCPSHEVLGEDVDPGAARREDFGLKCRLYRAGGRYSPVPPDEWIRAALAGTR